MNSRLPVLVCKLHISDCPVSKLQWNGRSARKPVRTPTTHAASCTYDVHVHNKYGNRKDKDYNAIISAKNLDLHYQSVTFGTFGSFGTGTWSVITKACEPAMSRSAAPPGRYVAGRGGV
eukprot:COSAG02_NODE_3391_length_6821_cov_16.598929_1_plen_119_part_00